MIGMSLSVVVLCYLYRDLRELFVHRGHFSFRGWSHSNVQILVQYVLLILGVLSVSYWFDLNAYFRSLLLGISFIGFTLVVNWTRKFSVNVHNFDQFILILSHLSAHFKMSHKILSSLEEVLLVVDASHKNLIKELIDDAYQGYDMETSFITLGSHYLLRSMVSLMVHAERFGDDDIDRGLSLLERDVDDLHEDVYGYIKLMHDFRRKLVLLCVFGVGIALVSRNMLRMVVDLNLSVAYQNTSYVFLLSMVLVLVLAHRVFTHDLLMNEELLK